MMGLLLSICVVAQSLSMHGDCKTLLPNTLEFFCLYGPRNLDAIGLVHYQGPDIGKMH